MDKTAAQAKFEDKAARQLKQASMTRQSKATDEELACLNYELKTRRRARLKQLYDGLDRQYEAELGARGLASIKERL